MSDSEMHPTMARLYEAAEKLRQVKGQSAVARLMNASPQTVKNWEARGVSKQGAIAAQKIVGCSVEWLLNDEGPMEANAPPATANELRLRAKLLSRVEEPEAEYVPGLLNEIQLSIVDSLERDLQSHEEETTRIPEYSTGGRMGDAGVLLRDQPGEIRGWEVTREWLRKNVPNCTSPGNLAIVTGFGDSMRPLYNPGDPLLVDRGVSRVEFDAIYFFRVGDEGFIKRLQRIPGNGLVAISENSSYRDWTITPEMEFEVFGRVIKVWRGEDF